MGERSCSACSWPPRQCSWAGAPTDPFSGQTYFFFAPLFIPILILGVPIIDTALRGGATGEGRSGVTTADKGHLHHRLMRLGHGQRRSVIILWLWTALLSAFVLYPAYTGKGDALVPLAIAALCLFLFSVLSPAWLRGGREDRGQEAPDATAEPTGQAAAEAVHDLQPYDPIA